MKPGQLQFLLIFGKTGSGKSEILRCLQNKGEQVLDLEFLAKHNGSVFGGLGGKQQLSQEVFEQAIKERLDSFHPDRPVWVEYESNYLGRLQIPGWLLNEMSRGKMIVLIVSAEKRIKRIIRTYSEHPVDKLLNAASKIRHKLNPKKYRRIRRSIMEQDYETAVSLLLTYYDRIYENALKRSEAGILVEMEILGDSPEGDAIKIAEAVSSIQGV